MINFKELFEAYGADYQTTMNRFMGNEALYVRLLAMLFDDQNLRQLGTALDRGDLRSAFEAAHTLKGVVGNMGLTPLYQAVCAIVEPLRNGEPREDYPALYQAIEGEFQKADGFRENLMGGGQE